MSASCQSRHDAMQRIAPLFRSLIGDSEQRGRDCQSERLRRVQVDDQRICHSRLHWQVTRPKDLGKATKKRSALRDAEREGPNSNFDPLCQLAPAVDGWGFFRRPARRPRPGALIDVIDAVG